MFYSVDLLTLRRHGEFAKCWLAANLTRKAFCTKFRREIIFDINVAGTCNKLIENITIRNISVRFSLYLSSQLMFGVTRIFCYQIDMQLKHHWELWQMVQISKTLKKKDKTGTKIRKNVPLPLEDPLQLELIEPPPAAHILSHIAENVGQITLADDDGIYNIYEMMREAQLIGDFGTATAEEITLMLQHDGLPYQSPDLDQVRIVPDIDDEELSHVFQEPPAVLHPEVSGIRTFDLDEIPQTKDIAEDETLLPRHIEPHVQNGIPHLNDEVPGTPIKHKLPAPVDIETPRTKRRRLETECDPVAQPPVLPRIEQSPEPSSLLLESLDSSVLKKRPKKQSKKLIIDEAKKLPPPVLRLLDCTVPMDKRLFQKPPQSSIQLLKMPSTRPVWGKPLLVMYEIMILEASPAESTFHTGTPRPDPTTDIVRGRPSSVTEGSSELSREDIIKPAIEVSKDDKINTLEPSDLMQGDLPALVPQEPHDMPDTFGESTGLPEVPEIMPDAYPEVSTVLRPISLSRENGSNALTDFIRRDSEAQSSSRNGEVLVIEDVRGSLATLWSLGEPVRFRDICPPASCNKMYASQLFVQLLRLHKLKEVKLMQAYPYKNIYIQEGEDSF